MAGNDLWTLKIPIELREVDDQPASSKAALLARVRELAPDPSVFEGENAVQPFLWRTTISTNKIDSYGTVMQPSTLKNFADDAARGVPVLESHNSYNLPIGRSLTGKYSGPQGTGLAKVLSDAYMTPGLSNGRVSTDDMILGIRSGVYTDASVGFRGGEIICSICEAPMFGRGAKCLHWPGETYTDADGNNPKVAIGRVENANLGEFSMVYDGATPDAMVDKIYRMVQSGDMDYPDVHRLQVRYGFKPDPIYELTSRMTKQETPATPELPDGWEIRNEGNPSNPQWVLTPKGDSVGTEEQRNEQAETLSKQLEEANRNLAAALTRAGAPAGSGADWFADEITRLRPLADMGNTYKADLIESAVVEGRRARGTEFTEETWRGMMAGMTIDQIKQVRTDFEKVASKLLQGGRQTTDGEEPEQKDDAATEDTDRRSGIPAAYYRA